MLNLPDDPTGLEQAKAAVADAYARIRSYLHNHPWNRMGQLERRFDDLLASTGIANIPFFGQQFLQCASFACGVVNSVASQYDNALAAYNNQLAVFDTSVNSGSVKGNTEYRVSDGPVTYNGVEYQPGDTFTGSADSSEFQTTSGKVTQKPTVLSDVQREKRAQVNEVISWIDDNGTL